MKEDTGPQYFVGRGPSTFERCVVQNDADVTLENINRVSLVPSSPAIKEQIKFIYGGVTCEDISD